VFFRADERTAKYYGVSEKKRGPGEGRAKREIKRALWTHQEREGLENLKAWLTVLICSWSKHSH